MKNQRINIVTRTFRWGVLFVVALLLSMQVMPHALGQRQRISSKRISQASSRLNGGTWTFTGSLSTGRFLHTATLLPSGLVLVVGGNDASFHPTASAELYDPASGTWTATGSLNTA